MLYNGKPVDLSPEEEEVRFYWIVSFQSSCLHVLLSFVVICFFELLFSMFLKIGPWKSFLTLSYVNYCYYKNLTRWIFFCSLSLCFGFCRFPLCLLSWRTELICNKTKIHRKILTWLEESSWVKACHSKLSTLWIYTHLWLASLGEKERRYEWAHTHIIIVNYLEGKEK